ncbi:hypothetical protein F5884DRAFT_312578 [Xylogone sp. PMI_703]|nr:hypothetical protein F5884DRAFT_312578 [Xylogone sp. PMI_703]
MDMAKLSSKSILPAKRPSGIYVHVDDWSGRKEITTRRKIQNRLNQRARRQRAALQSHRSLEAPSVLPKTFTQAPYLLVEYPIGQADATASEASFPESVTSPPDVESQVSSWMSHRILRRLPIDHTTQQILLDLEATPPVEPSSNPCPLSADHLLTLVYYNVVRAFVSNTLCLGIEPDLICDEILSPFCSPSYSPVYNNLPPNLQPTQLQVYQQHHPYIDLLPSSTVRDNLLRADNNFDDLELWNDTIGTMIKCGGELKGCSEVSGLLVWGEPSDVRNWEVSEEFARKWAWTLKGCSDLLEATSYWRRRRGEEDLVFEI